MGDYQLERFKAEPSNRGHVLDRGLWRYTRHPNYFGDATLWWGLYVIASATPYGWFTVTSPALMSFLLMRVSGVTLLENGLKASKPGYRVHRAHPGLLPLVSARAAMSGVAPRRSIQNRMRVLNCNDLPADGDNLAERRRRARRIRTGSEVAVACQHLPWHTDHKIADGIRRSLTAILQAKRIDQRR